MEYCFFLIDWWRADWVWFTPQHFHTVFQLYVIDITFISMLYVYLLLLLYDLLFVNFT